MRPRVAVIVTVTGAISRVYHRIQFMTHAIIIQVSQGFAIQGLQVFGNFSHVQEQCKSHATFHK